MIITDGIHLISDESIEELHKFAKKLGLKRSWFQDHKKHPHYDLTSIRMKEKAIKMGCVFIGSRDLVRLNRGRGNRGQTRGTRERAPVSDPRGRNRGVCGSCPSFVIIDEDLKE